MRRLLFSPATVCGLVLFCSLATRAQAGLEDSGEKKITVATEIARGHAVVTQAFVNAPLDGILSVCVAIERPVAVSRTTGDDSQGFLLGARYTQWTILLHLLEKPDDATATQSCRALADQCFSEFRELQKTLGVDDLGLITTAGNRNPAPAVARLASWRPFSETVAAKQEQDRQAKAMATAAQEKHERLTKLPEFVKASQVRAVKAYPDLGTAGTQLNKRFVERFKALQAEKSPRLQEPDWPEKLADECAAAVTTAANR